MQNNQHQIVHLLHKTVKNNQLPGHLKLQHSKAELLPVTISQSSLSLQVELCSLSTDNHALSSDPIRELQQPKCWDFRIHSISSFDMRYLKLKLWGIHKMFLWDFPTWLFFRVFLRGLGRDCWIISTTPAEQSPASFAKVSMIFGNETFLSLRTPKLARIYSSLAVSRS